MPCLQMLIDSGHEICAVYTQPDRPSGRGQKAKLTPVKALAEAHGIPVRQPETLRTEEAQRELESFKADLMVVVAYGLILPRAVLDAPKLGCVNVHASLLPRWRGAAPIQRSIFAGDKETGVTIMFIEPKLDAGPMLLKASLPILPLETSAQLHDRLSHLGASALKDCLPGIEDGSLKAEVQDESLVTYAEKLSKSDAAIDWSRPALELEYKIRAYHPWPVAETRYGDSTLRIWLAEALADERKGAPGEVLSSKKNLDVATGSGVLRLLEVQMPNGKRMSAQAFLNAHDLSSVRFA